MITIYGKDMCSYCTAAKNLLENRGLFYQYLELGKDFSQEDVMTQFPGKKTFPIIVLDGSVLDDGYTSLRLIIDDLTGGFGDGAL